MPRNRISMSVILALILAVVPFRMSYDNGVIAATPDTALAKNGGQGKSGKHVSGKKAKTMNTSRSNRTTKLKSETTSRAGILESGVDISLFPNPNQGMFSTIINSKASEEKA